MRVESPALRDLVASVAVAYFSKTRVDVAQILPVLNQIAQGLAQAEATALQSVDAEAHETSPQPVAAGSERLDGAQVAGPLNRPDDGRPRQIRTQIEQSITADGLISFEDGRTYRALKRHLAGRGLTPEQYRAKWGLPDDYPMVCASFSAKRSELAKRFGLGSNANARVRKAARSRA
jgi:predicted transcriptional regulator